MTLQDFLLHKTNAQELCAITDGGWVIATVWIDHEDMFVNHLSHELANKKVKHTSWDTLTIVDGNNSSVKIPCRFIEV